LRTVPSGMLHIRCRDEIAHAFQSQNHSCDVGSMHCGDVEFDGLGGLQELCTKWHAQQRAVRTVRCVYMDWVACDGQERAQVQNCDCFNDVHVHRSGERASERARARVCVCVHSHTFCPESSSSSLSRDSLDISIALRSRPSGHRVNRTLVSQVTLISVGRTEHPVWCARGATVWVVARDGARTHRWARCGDSCVDQRDDTR
jgi:hypothetical protein